MKTAVVYYSFFGNTHMVARAVSGAIREYAEVRLLGMGGLSPVDIHDAELLVAGSPTHNMNLPIEVRDALDALPKNTLAGKACAAFDTSYQLSRWLQPFTASRRLAKRLQKLGGNMIVAPERFLVEHDHEGPLYPGEIERAQAWARAILEQMEGKRVLV